MSLVAAGTLVVNAAAQDPQASSGHAAETRVVTVGATYAGSGTHRAMFGSGYRDLWTTPARLEVLDLRREGGGLTPVRQVGQAQGVGLALQGADGRAYTFRSLHKEPQRMLPEAWREATPGRVVQDLVAGTHPAAGVIYPVLAEAAGVPHTNSRLVIMPDDQALGAFRETFANLTGTIEEYPLPSASGTPGFMGATEIIPSTEMWKRWMAGPENRLDTRAYLRARIVELMVDNFDRHRGQWRWMKLPGQDAWAPLPEDPDFVFLRRDGLMMYSMRSQAPQFLIFSGKYPRRLDGALGNGAEMDRWVLSGLTAQDVETIARDAQSRMTDEVFEQALRRMPAEWYAIDGPGKIEALRARRAGLVDYLLRVYRYHAQDVDIQATDRSERVTIARAADGSLDVAVALAEGPGEPYYHRRFVPAETREVRIFLHGGDDRVERSGEPGGPIRVRVIAGGGRDVVDDSTSGGTDVWRDSGTIEVKPGAGTNVRNDPWINPAPVKDAPWIEPRSWGHWTVPAPLLGYAPDVRVYLGYGFTRTSYGFRTLPNKSVQTFQGAIATGDMTGKLQYLGTFRRPGTALGYRLQAYASGVESYNYFGPGNESENVTDRAVYQTRETVLFFSPALRVQSGPRFELHLAPEVRYSRTPSDARTIVATQAPTGAGEFGLLALRAGFSFDSRQDALFKVRADLTQSALPSESELHASGVRIQAAGFIVPSAWDVPSKYGGVDGVIAAYAGGSRAHLALRVGGRKLWGDYAWFDAAYIGGANNRGYSAHRFAGDSSLYGTVSLRSWLGSVSTPLVPIRLGVVGFTDAGRVWVAGEQSKTWHTSVGGGLLVQPVALPFVANVVVGHSREGNRVYFGLGYPF